MESLAKGFDMSENTSSTKSRNRPDEDVLLDLNFVPQWAKKDPGENHYHAAMERSERSDRRGGPRRDRREGPPRSDRRPPRRDGDRPPRRDGDRPPRRDGARAPHREFQSRPAKVDLPVIIKFLPEQKRLASLVRQIHHSKRAYPLIDLAHIFLS
ncbi:MAG TPA: hypothetical protein VJ904_02825, partial [Tichowtungia sp.]|nr:hypothetical protein [Tichowtungia sp.]